MITFATNAVAIKQLAKVLEGDARQLTRDVKTAVNKAVDFVQSQWAKDIGKEVALPQKTIRTTLRKEIARGIENPSGSVSQSKTKRLPLKEYKPRQTAAGVSYSAYKKAKRKTLASAFMGPKPGAVARRLGGHVFSRTGKSRLPIVKRFGPTPFDTTKRFDIPEQLLPIARQRLLEELTKRVRFRVGKKTGAF
jgi:hypothetical protein